MPQMRVRRAKRLAALETASSSVPISFAIVGVQKAATTSLYRMLLRHPRIVGGSQKELRFFIEPRDWADPDYATYRRPLKRPVPGALAGDATPAYLFWPHAMERMRAYRPDLRLMACFRDPIERAFSHWAMERHRHDGFPDLPTAIEQFGRDPLPESVDERDPSPVLRRSLFSRGLYGAQLERALGLFPVERWELYEFRELLGGHERSLDRATDLLELPRFETYPSLDHRMATSPGITSDRPTVAAVAGLVERYADDLVLFERLSGLDTSSWPTRQVIDGALAVEDLHAKLCAKLAPAT
jgi:hypothetical protein